jgi:dipeptidyl aminopeptidase/acylaminoacyl peptidase
MNSVFVKVATSATEILATRTAVSRNISLLASFTRMSSLAPLPLFGLIFGLISGLSSGLISGCSSVSRPGTKSEVGSPSAAATSSATNLVVNPKDTAAVISAPASEVKAIDAATANSKLTDLKTPADGKLPESKGATPSTVYQGLGAESVSAEVVQKFAPPVLDAETAGAIRSLLDVQAPGLGQPTSDGKVLFFGWAISGAPQVWKIDKPLGFPVQVTGGADPTSLLTITPDDRFLVLSRDRSGEENPGIYLQSTKGGAVKKIYHKPKVQARFAWITNDSKYLYYFTNETKADSFEFFRYELATEKTDKIFDQPGLWSVADVKHDRYFLFSRAVTSRESEYSVFDAETKKLTPIVGQGELAELEVSFAEKDNEYLVATNKFGEFTRLYIFKPTVLKKDAWKPITPEKSFDLEGFVIDQNRKNIYLSWNEKGLTKLESLSASTYQPIAVPQFKDADQTYVGKVTRKGRYVTLGVETATAPRSSYVWDRTNGKTTKWVLPSIPEIDSAKFLRSEVSSFRASDGFDVPMLITRPKVCADDACPIVVHFHGGPEGQSRPGFNKLAQIFALNGFIFVEPNVRGSEGYGKSYLASDNGAKRLGVITDIEDCAKHLKGIFSSKYGNPPKIGVMGWSYGGYSTLYAMTRFAGAYDAGVALVGMSNLVSFLKNTAPYRRTLRISEYGDPEKDFDALQKLSPVTYLDQLKSPLMIVQGVSDPRVPVGEAVQMNSLLTAKNIPTKLILFSDEGHGAIKKDNKVLELGHTLKFFKENLLSKK